MRVYCAELKGLVNFTDSNLAPFDFDIGHLMRMHLQADHTTWELLVAFKVIQIRDLFTVDPCLNTSSLG